MGDNTRLPVYNCGTCNFSSRDSSAYPFVECRRHAPLSVTEGDIRKRIFPMVHSSADCCGDWEPHRNISARFGNAEKV